MIEKISYTFKILKKLFMKDFYCKVYLHFIILYKTLGA